jgi:glycosyltransferase involved in cell wall biosynthesis
LGGGVGSSRIHKAIMRKKEKKKLQPLLSVIIISKNEEKKLPDCLESVKWADEIILVDTGSTDTTIEIAKKSGAKIYHYEKGSYQDWRNKGLSVASGKWILYIDADERVAPELHQEIKSKIQMTNDKEERRQIPGQARNDDFAKSCNAYAIPRKNIILGKEMRHGGQWPDYQKRLFKRSALEKWKGDLHEEPVFDGELGHLKEAIVHIKHAHLSEMVEKTNKWSELEAKMLYATGHPQMVWWRFIRIMMTELWIRLIKQGGILDGVEGIIYGIYQSWSRFITYGKLWEMQIRKDIK